MNAASGRELEKCLKHAALSGETGIALEEMYLGNTTNFNYAGS